LGGYSLEKKLGGKAIKFIKGSVNKGYVDTPFSVLRHKILLSQYNI